MLRLPGHCFDTSIELKESLWKLNAMLLEASSAARRTSIGVCSLTEIETVWVAESVERAPYQGLLSDSSPPRAGLEGVMITTSEPEL